MLNSARGATWLVSVAKKNNTSLLQQSVEMAIHKYLDDLDGELPCNLFDTVISEVEQPMLKTMLRHCDNNQSRTASCLGINRGTLRKKLKQYCIEH
jgi:Fis family transcriptional regulator